MKITMTGNVFVENPRRMAGTYQIAYAVTTPSGKTGTALFHYEYDKRDVMAETLLVTPEIADEMREYIGDDSPAVFGSFCFPKPEETNQNGSAVTAAIEEATEAVFLFDG